MTSYPHPWLMPDFWQEAASKVEIGPRLKGIFNE
jgi:pyruvate dehydrogenase complex dehydrogenase (E1) component